ncbi:MAG: PEP-CTERM sorting domain-containing protein [Pseudomonadota bacterium]
MKNIWRWLAALALSIMAAGHAGAQSSASAQLSNLRWELNDLNLDDGIAPSLAFRPMELGRHSSVRWQYLDQHTGMTRYDLAWGGGFPDALVAAAPTFADEPHLRIELLGSVIGNNFENAVVHASANGLDRVGAMWGTMVALSDAINLTLSPNTAVSFFADAAVHSTADREAGPGYMSVGRSFARIWFSPDRNNWSETVLEHIAEYGQDSGAGFDQTLKFTYGNLGSYDAHLSLHLEGIATVSTVLAPIPEPGTWLMLVAGLALIGQRAAFKKSRKRACSRSPPAAHHA